MADDIDVLKRVLPKEIANTLSPTVQQQIQDMLDDPDNCEIYRDNLIGYTQVLKEGRFKIQDYINAVKYVSFKHMGCTNIDSYIKTFPDRYKRLLNQGSSDKDISAYVAGYHSTKLVKTILDQSMMPLHMSHMDTFLKAVKTQAELMVTAASDKVRCDAADSIMRHLKPPEESKIKMDIGVTSNPILDQLAEATTALVNNQKRALAEGSVTLKDIGRSNIIPGEYDEVDDDNNTGS